MFPVLPTPMPTEPPPTRDDDLRRVAATLRRAAPIILLSAVLSGGAASLLATRQAPLYESSSSLVTLPSDGSNGLLRDSTFAAPPLQRGALAEALENQDVLRNVLNSLRGSTLPDTDVQEMSGELQAQLAGGTPVLTVEARNGTPQDNGIYEVRGRATTPTGARALASAGASALLRWDAERARRRLLEVRSSLERQFDVLDARLSSSQGPQTRRAELEQETLVAARDQVLRNLAQVTALEQSTTGSLDLLAVASPARSLLQSPLRKGLLAALLTLLLSAGAALLLDRTRRRIYDVQDLQGWGVPLLGHLPALRGPSAGQGPGAASAGLWRDPVGFLRVNVLSQLGPGRPRSLVIASPNPAEGKSTVTAALAASLAASGERVLIVDADSQDPAQMRLWRVGAAHGERGVQAVHSARVQAESIPVQEGVDLLLATALRRADGGLDYVQLREWLDAHAMTYDSVLFDTPPLLTSPDAVTLAAHTGGLVLIAVPGQTFYRDLEAAFATASTAQARILGLLLNERPVLRNTAKRPAQSGSPAPGREPGEAAVR